MRTFLDSALKILNPTKQLQKSKWKLASVRTQPNGPSCPQIRPSCCLTGANSCVCAVFSLLFIFHFFLVVHRVSSFSHRVSLFLSDHFPIMLSSPMFFIFSFSCICCQSFSFFAPLFSIFNIFVLFLLLCDSFLHSCPLFSDCHFFVPFSRFVVTFFACLVFLVLFFFSFFFSSNLRPCSMFFQFTMTYSNLFVVASDEISCCSRVYSLFCSFVFSCMLSSVCLLHSLCLCGVC